MNSWIEQVFFIILILAFTPVAFALMPVIVIAAVGGAIYMVVMTRKKQHHLE